MYSIGDLSQLAGVTSRMLRHYHEFGILVPAEVDNATGYRRYDPLRPRRASRLRSARSSPMTRDGRDIDDHQHMAAAAARLPCVLLTHSRQDFPARPLAEFGVRVADPDNYLSDRRLTRRTARDGV